LQLVREQLLVQARPQQRPEQQTVAELRMLLALVYQKL
jgi:hypothetical protein